MVYTQNATQIWWLLRLTHPDIFDTMNPVFVLRARMAEGKTHGRAVRTREADMIMEKVRQPGERKSKMAHLV